MSAYESEDGVFLPDRRDWQTRPIHPDAVCRIAVLAGWRGWRVSATFVPTGFFEPMTVELATTWRWTARRAARRFALAFRRAGFATVVHDA